MIRKKDKKRAILTGICMVIKGTTRAMTEVERIYIYKKSATVR